MKTFEVGQRVSIPTHSFLSNGIVSKVINSPYQNYPFAHVITLDEKAPKEYAYNTHEVMMFANDIELEDTEK